jgi:hypothetical protein
MPALHCAITKSGPEMINSGAPITGIDKRPLNKAGILIRQNPSSFVAGQSGHVRIGHNRAKLSS